MVGAVFVAVPDSARIRDNFEGQGLGAVLVIIIIFIVDACE